jgi:hypothetical protein
MTSKLVKCPACHGACFFQSLGCMDKTKCAHCLGTGKVYESEKEIDGEQNDIEDTKDFSRKETVDSSSPERGKTKRRYVRKGSTLGSSQQGIPEREESGKDNQEVGNKETESQQSSE